MKQERKGKQIWRCHFKSMHWGRLDDVGKVAPDLEKYAQGPYRAMENTLDATAGEPRQHKPVNERRAVGVGGHVISSEDCFSP
jgi:hypothetical protein